MNDHRTKFLLRVCVMVTLGIFVVEFCGCPAKPKTRLGKVIGGSMAPTLLGEHLLFQCEGCQSEVVCDFEQASKRPSFLICPYCGERNAIDNAKRTASDQVTVELGGLNVKRWEIVAFKSHDGEAGIKRIVGLPGETVEIKNGDLYQAGQLIRKPVEVQRQMRILVHDSGHPNPSLTQWTDSKPSDGLNWSSFVASKNYMSKPDATKSTLNPIEDNYGYNQSINRVLNPMTDLFLELETRPGECDTVAWRLGDQKQFEFTVDLKGGALRVVDRRASEVSADKSFQFKQPNLDAPCLIEFSSFDQQLNVWVNEVRIFKRDLEPRDRFSSNLIQVAAEKGPIHQSLDRLRIWRDIYYLPANEAGFNETTVLEAASNEFLLMGDNSPISRDSRHWNPPGLPRTQIIGVVKMPAINRYKNSP